MKQIWSGIQIAFTALGGFLGWFLGGGFQRNLPQGSDLHAGRHR